MKLKLTKKDKILTKDSALVVADHIIDQIAKTIPVISIAWGLSKALFEAGMKLRQQRALEWVEMIRDNPAIFTKEILADTAFQDGFVVALEKYLIERNEEKRKIFRNIFLGYTNARDKAKFPLEKFIHTLSQLSETDVEVLRDTKVDEEGLDYKNYQIYGGNYNRIENIYNLIGLGLLLDVTGNRIGHNPQNSPFVKPTFFCKEFVKYLNTN
jgi:hypothetical protein